MSLHSVRLDWLEVKNYLGAGEDGARLELGCDHAALCGPNNSGKTTMLSVIPFLRKLCGESFSNGDSPLQIMLGWKNTQHASAELFHQSQAGAHFSAAFRVGTEFSNLRAILDKTSLPPPEGSIALEFHVSIKPRQKMLKSIINMATLSFAAS